MERVGLGAGVVAVVVALVMGIASPARAHGDEPDVRRIAVGTVAGFDVTVWTSDTPSAAGLPLTIGMESGPDIHVTVVATQPGGQTTVVPADAVDGGHWAAVVPLSSSGPTSLELVVADATASGTLVFDYLAPFAPWWMKVIVVLALVQGIACAGWLWGRRGRVFNRSTVGSSEEMAGSTAG